MANENAHRHTRTIALIAIPSLISLAVTFLRLTGELLNWSTVLFNPDAGGGGSIIGITWLAPIFGIYFAMKLSKAGNGPARAGRAIGLAFLALVLTVCGIFVGFAPQVEFPGKTVVGLLLVAASGIIPLVGWPSLFKVQLAYAYAARIPVAIIMFFAIRGQWGTHYDVLPPGFPPETGFWPTYLLIGFLPQMVYWIVFTVVTGSLFGSISAALFGRGKQVAQTAGT
ncbi:MAG TPA: hypothetical protein VNO14_17365 [Blastocatellia bacterium]|nr:hypothetical protein [Blastocatellia bacterium]